jgi:Fic family protein
VNTKLLEQQKSTRAGEYRLQSGGFAAFCPTEFPPTDFTLDFSLASQLSAADRALGNLIGAAEALPDTDVFVFMYVRREAVLSSQIEGTEASLMDLLEWEQEAEREEHRIPVREISNYIQAMRHGLDQLSNLPLSQRLIRSIHEVLMEGVRGGETHRTPGEFRRSQNWVGGPTPQTATYVPPPVPQMREALNEYELFLHTDTAIPPLIQVALAHAQFETIHPFLDGNGRMGRLLITFQLAAQGILREPILYLSIFFKRNRRAYYDRLQAVRDEGDWEGWVSFFLQGVVEVASDASATVSRVTTLRDETREQLTKEFGRRSGNALQVLDRLFTYPLISVRDAVEITGLSQPAANRLVNDLAGAGVLSESTGRKRDRLFRFDSYLDLFAEREARG